jgi:hypothetical protein
VKRVVDEVLADTRGYSSKEWERFLFVIYETVRLKPEVQWRAMLRENNIPASTDVIVISGESARTKSTRGSLGKRKRTLAPGEDKSNKMRSGKPL